MARLVPHNVIMDDVHPDFMRHALSLARCGEGAVEPNPMVGAVVVRSGQIVGEGWHERFGGPHAEVIALERAGPLAQGADLYVTLEPCCHHGKTPPCTDAVLRSGAGRVIIGHLDPFPEVAGQGAARLRQAGVPVIVGCLEAEARFLTAPYRKRLRAGQPWVIAKWAMTLDGKLATASGDSRWITGPEARAQAHRLRGRVDGILVGIGTVLQDDPLLTARPPGPRLAARIVLDHHLRIPLESQLVRSATEVPLWVMNRASASPERRAALEARGVRCIACPEATAPAQEIAWLLTHLGQQSWTNLMVEGGSQVLGSFLAAGAIDEVEVYLAPMMVGGAAAPSAIGGPGAAALQDALTLAALEATPIGKDWCLRGRVQRPES